MFNDITERAIQWLHAKPALLRASNSFEEYCQRVKALDPSQSKLVEFYSSLSWLPPMFMYAKRFPNNPLIKTLYFPAIDNLHELFEEFIWVASNVQRHGSPSNDLVYITTHHIKSYKILNKTPANWHGLYAKPTPLLRDWIEKCPLDKTGSVALFERNDGVLLTWESSQIIATHWLAFITPDKLLAIPWELPEQSI